ncbi:MAG: head decoration protein [Proteobacteria bacterium]|nr:head decoration protein [Pseudomonadota bacterium]
MTNYGPNAFAPGMVSDAFIPDQLIADVQPLLVTDTVTLTGAAALARGAVLGRTVTAGTATATAGGSNTGTGAMGAITVAGGAREGTYRLNIVEAVTNQGRFELFGPRGDLVGVGEVGVAFTGGGLAFTLADGTPDYAVGDTFTIKVTSPTVKYKLSVATATDGSQTPVAILVDNTDPSGGDVTCGVYIGGCFNANALSFDTSHTIGSVRSALDQRGGMVIRTVSGDVSNADPS